HRSLLQHHLADQYTPRRGARRAPRQIPCLGVEPGDQLGGVHDCSAETSVRSPVSMSTTKPRTAVEFAKNGLRRTRSMDWRTSASASLKVSTAQVGRRPVAS